MSELAPARLVVDDGSGVGLYLPPAWERVELAGVQLAVAGPVSRAAADGTTFRPSVIVSSVPVTPDADIRTLGTEAAAAATVAADGVYLLAYDLWSGPAGVTGRRLEFAYQQGSVPLCVTQWILLDDATAITVTATCGVAQFLSTRPLIDHALSGLRTAGGDQ